MRFLSQGVPDHDEIRSQVELVPAIRRLREGTPDGTSGHRAGRPRLGCGPDQIGDSLREPLGRLVRWADDGYAHAAPGREYRLIRAGVVADDHGEAGRPVGRWKEPVNDGRPFSEEWSQVSAQPELEVVVLDCWQHQTLPNARARMPCRDSTIAAYGAVAPTR